MQQMDRDVNTTSNGQLLDFSFTGSGSEYFRIWIVNTMLTILTLGIYSAWAKVRTNQYFYGNTVLDDARFSYLADPKQILKGRVIAVIIFVLYSAAWQFFPTAALALLAVGCLLFPFFIVSSMSFKCRNSAYRHIRFKFVKDLKQAYLIFMQPLGTALLVTAVIYYVFDAFGLQAAMLAGMEESGEYPGGVLESDVIYMVFFLCIVPFIPWLDFLNVRFVVDHAQYGKTPMNFTGRCKSFYWIYFVAVLVMILGIVLMSGVMFGATSAMGEPTEDNISSAAPMFLIGMLVFYTSLFFVSGIMKAMRMNLINRNTFIGSNQLKSDLNGFKIGWIYLTNTIGIILTLGLFIPWAKVRMARYTANRTQLNAVDIASIRAAEQENGNAFGEEMGDVFDMDLGI